jgi:ferritin-like metal-binding protein YciE
MFERLNNPQEAYNFKLGAALKMEQTVLEMLEENIENAQEEKTKDLFHHHHQETQGHVRNIEQAFQALDWEMDTSPCPAIEGIEKEGKANVKKSDDSIVDIVILQGAVETEHHEIGVYENLILNARAIGRDDVAEILERNLEDERHTLEEVRDLEAQLAGAGAQQPA